MAPDAEPIVPALPVEAIEHIFSFLRDDRDIPSLKACMSTNRLFRELGEKYHWHHFTIHNYYGEDEEDRMPLRNAETLIEALERAPHLEPYMRSLEILIEMFGEMPLCDEEIGPALAMLSHLERIYFTGSMIPWNRFSRAFQAALKKTMSLPSVERVNIQGLKDFPLLMFSQCTALKKISLTRSSFILGFDHGMEPLQISSTRPKLESLHVWNTPSVPTILAWLRHVDFSPDITTLRLIAIEISTVEELNEIAEILQGCSDSLRVCELALKTRDVYRRYDVHNGHGVAPEHNLTPPPFVLSKMTRLRSLIIAGNLIVEISQDDTPEKDGSYSTPFSWLCSVFETMLPSLSHITLNILFFLPELRNLQWINWEELARALSSSHLVGLRRVVLHATFETNWYDLDGCVGVFRNDPHLSELIKSGLLEVEVEM